MYFYLINHVRTWDDIQIIVMTAAVFLFFESALMLMQYFSGLALDLGGLVQSKSYGEGAGAGVSGARVAGTLLSAAGAAVYLNSMLAIIISAYLTAKMKYDKFLVGVFFMGIIALIVTFSRSGWASFAVSMAIILSRATLTEIGRKAVPLFLVGGVVIAFFFGPKIVARFTTVGDDESRETLAVMAYNIIDKYPLGVGANNYDQHMSDKYADPTWVGHRHRPVHNKYLLIWTQLGPQG